MIGHDEILAALIRKIDSGEVRQIDVARRLNIAPARVAEMRIHKRRIQSSEMAPLAQFLGLAAEEPVKRPITASIGIPHLGKVAQGVWIEQSLADPENPEFVEYDMEPADRAETDLFAVTPEGLSMNRLFPSGIKLICRRIPFSLEEYKTDDLVIVERHNHDLREMTCKRLKIDENGIFWLHSDSDQPQFQGVITMTKHHTPYSASDRQAGASLCITPSAHTLDALILAILEWEDGDDGPRELALRVYQIVKGQAGV